MVLGTWYWLAHTPAACPEAFVKLQQTASQAKPLLQSPWASCSLFIGFGVHNWVQACNYWSGHHSQATERYRQGLPRHPQRLKRSARPSASRRTLFSFKPPSLGTNTSKISKTAKALPLGRC